MPTSRSESAAGPIWIDRVLITWTALVAGAWLPFAPWPVCAAAVFSGCLLFHRLGPVWLLVLSAGLGCGAYRASRAAHTFELSRVAARDSLGEPQRCELEGSVESSPVWSSERLNYSLRVKRASCDSGLVSTGTLVRLSGGPAQLSRGDSVLCIAELAPIEWLRNPDLLDPTAAAAQRGFVLSGASFSVRVLGRTRSLGSWVDGARAHVRARIFATFAPAVEPMARALVLGESDLAPSDAAAFRQSGLSHMLAVSGTHLVFAVASVAGALRALLVRLQFLSARWDVARISSACGIALALVYAEFAGSSGSADRAAWMLSAAFAARVLGLPLCPSRTLAVSLGLGWATNPFVAFDLSFLLSAAATVGLLVLAKPLAAPLQRTKVKLIRALGAGMATSLGAMLPCAPLLLMFGDGLTLVGVFSNLVAAPLGETLALPLCLTHALTSAWPALELGLAQAASGALFAVRWVALVSAAQTYFNVPLPAPTGFQIALMVGLGQALFLIRNQPRLRKQALVVAGVLGLYGLELLQSHASKRPGTLSMTLLAVGQGDATLLDLPDGKLMLIDAGGSVMGGADPGERVVLPTLAARRRARVDVVVLSHPHPDHFGGLWAVLNQVEVGEIWDTGQGHSEGAGPTYAAIRKLADTRGIRVREPSELCRSPHDFGAARLHVLAPCPAFVKGRSANDNSFVLRLEFGAHAFLFMGDAEQAAEAELLARGVPLWADVLKVGHHGSRTSTHDRFLSYVQPRLATISCGIRNRFGHPSPEVLGRLGAHSAYIWRTDQQGGAVIRSDGQHLRLQPWL